MKLFVAHRYRVSPRAFALAVLVLVMCHKQVFNLTLWHSVVGGPQEGSDVSGGNESGQFVIIDVVRNLSRDIKERGRMRQTGKYIARCAS